MPTEGVQRTEGQRRQGNETLPVCQGYDNLAQCTEVNRERINANERNHIATLGQLPQADCLFG